MPPASESIRVFLIAELRNFVARVHGLPGVHRIAIIGSLATPKRNPKDADLLIWVDDGVDLTRLAAAGRRLKGRAQGRNCGADLFLVDPHDAYLGRICHYRDCRPGIRASCHALNCGRRPHLCDDLKVITLPSNVIQAPPVDLWPTVAVHTSVPEDIQEMVLAMTLDTPPTGFVL
jgi:hypothetical protein